MHKQQVGVGGVDVGNLRVGQLGAPQVQRRQAAAPAGQQVGQTGRGQVLAEADPQVLDGGQRAGVEIYEL